MVVYPAVFERDGKYISVEFPDFPEALTQGEDLAQAYEAAQEVLGMVLEDYKDLPKATDLAKVQSQYPKAAIALISVDMAAYMRKYHSKTVRKNVTVPEYLATMAAEKNINISKVLTEALEKKVQENLQA